MKLTINDFPEWNKKFLKDDFEMNVLLENLEFKSTYKILEVGCNNSELSNTLHSKGCEVWGVDVNQNNEAKFMFIKSNFQDANIPNDYFDIAIDVSAIHHFGLGNYNDRIDINADIESSKKIYSCLKNNGLFYVSTDRVGKEFNPNVNNYFRTYNIEEFINRIVNPPNFKLIDLKFYVNNIYPLTLIDYNTQDYGGSQMFTLLKKTNTMV